MTLPTLADLRAALGPVGRALLRLDRLMRRGYPIAFQRRIRAARARLEATADPGEVERAHHIVMCERQALRDEETFARLRNVGGDHRRL